MFRKMYQGGLSRKQGPMLAMRDADDEPPREEFNAYVRNADLESFEADKCR